MPDGPRSKVAKWHAISGKIIVLMAILTAINGVAREYTPYVYQIELYLAREGAETKGCSMSVCIYFGGRGGGANKTHAR